MTIPVHNRLKFLAGGVYSQMVHGESFEEPVGQHGVSGERFTNTWSGKSDDDGNTSYVTWQPGGGDGIDGSVGCTFGASKVAINGNQSQSVGCTRISGCSCGIVNRGVDAMGFQFRTAATATSSSPPPQQLPFRHTRVIFSPRLLRQRVWMLLLLCYRLQLLLN